MKTIIKITAILAAVPVLVGCSSTSKPSASTEKPSCAFTAQQMEQDAKDLPEIAMFRTYAKTGVAPKELRAKERNLTPEYASIVLAAYDAAMNYCK